MNGSMWWGAALTVTALLLPGSGFAPPEATAGHHELGDGRVRFEVVLPAGQAYVEVFVRQDGLQNVAQNIVLSAEPAGDGMEVYTLERGGYEPGELVEYRFYSYLPASPGVFTPGPAEGVWNRFTVGEYFETNDATYALSETLLDDGRRSNIEVYYDSDFSVVYPAGSGWILYRATPPSQAHPLLLEEAGLLGIYVQRCDDGSWVPLEQTPYAVYHPSLLIESARAGDYVLTNHAGRNYATGTPVNETYACGGTTRVVQTYIGPMELTTNAEVAFAYVVEHRGP